MIILLQICLPDSIDRTFHWLIKLNFIVLIRECTEKTDFFRRDNWVLVSIGGFLLLVSISCLLFYIWIKTQQQRGMY